MSGESDDASSLSSTDGDSPFVPGPAEEDGAKEVTVGGFTFEIRKFDARRVNRPKPKGSKAPLSKENVHHRLVIPIFGWLAPFFLALTDDEAVNFVRRVLKDKKVEASGAWLSRAT